MTSRKTETESDAMIKAVIFDMDGVLIDSEIVYLRHQTNILQKTYRMRTNLQRNNAAFAAQIWRRKRIKTQAFYSFPINTHIFESRPAPSEERL